MSNDIPRACRAVCEYAEDVMRISGCPPAEVACRSGDNQTVQFVCQDRCIKVTGDVIAQIHIVNKQPQPAFTFQNPAQTEPHFETELNATGKALGQAIVEAITRPPEGETNAARHRKV